MANPIRRGEVSSPVSSWSPSGVQFTPLAAMSLVNPYGLQLRHTLRNGSANPIIPTGINWVWVVCIGAGCAGYQQGNYTAGGGGGVSMGWTIARAEWYVALGTTTGTALSTKYGHIIAGGGGSSMGNAASGVVSGSGDDRPSYNGLSRGIPSNYNLFEAYNLTTASGFNTSYTWATTGQNLSMPAGQYSGSGASNIVITGSATGGNFYGMNGGNGYFTAGGGSYISLTQGSNFKKGGDGGSTAFYSGGLGATSTTTTNPGGGGGAGFFGPGQNAVGGTGGAGGDGGGGGGSGGSGGKGGDGGILIYY